MIPVFNERESLPELHRRLAAVMDCLDGESELLFIDDCSFDGSYDLLQELQRADPRVKVIEFARNFGHQVAITAGLDHADGDAVIVMDADLQDPPEVVLDLVARWQEGYEVVYAVRRSARARAGSSARRRRGSTALLRRIASVDMPLDAGDSASSTARRSTRSARCASATATSAACSAGSGSARSGSRTSGRSASPATRSTRSASRSASPPTASSASRTRRSASR